MGGSADNLEENKEVFLNHVSDKDESIKLKDITVSDSKKNLKESTEIDVSLQALRGLADRQLNGYSWKEGL